ncbi:hypothetical protein GJ496_006438 [Pomphorhynchus laevis]|nr:hypothetical protein GJ496_006438 [Pomphorhynchus laevis]
MTRRSLNFRSSAFLPSCGAYHSQDLPSLNCTQIYNVGVLGVEILNTHIIGNSKICSKLNSDRQNDQQEKNTAINEERKQVVQTSDQCFHNLMSAKIKESPSMLISLPYKHCFDDANFVDFVDYILQHNADGLDLFEIGLDVNYYISKLNKILNKPLMHNVYIMDTAVCTGRIFTEIISLVGGSRIKKKIHFVGIDVHPVVLAKAKYNVDRQIRQGSGRNVDCLAINFVKSPLDDILSESHNKHFHVIIVGQGSFHRLLTNSERLTFFQSVYSALLPNGICIMNIFPDLNVLSDKSHMHILPAKIEYPTVSENSTVNSQQKFYKSYNLIDRTIARSHSIDDTASIYTNGNDCFDLNIKREISRCSDNPAEIILSFSFELTSFETKHAHNPCHKCSINLRDCGKIQIL